jgi:hypothetical protein
VWREVEDRKPDSDVRERSEHHDDGFWDNDQEPSGGEMLEDRADQEVEWRKL